MKAGFFIVLAWIGAGVLYPSLGHSAWLQETFEVSDDEYDVSYDLPNSRTPGETVLVTDYPLTTTLTAESCRLDRQSQFKNMKNGDPIGHALTAVMDTDLGEGQFERAYFAFFVRDQECLVFQVAGLKDNRAVVKIFEIAAHSFKVLPLSPSQKVELYLHLGHALLEMEKPTDALLRFELAAQLDSGLLGSANRTDALFGQFMAGMKLGDSYSAKVEKIGRVLLSHRTEFKEMDDRQKILEAMAFLTLRDGHVKESENYYDELVVRYPHNAAALYGLAKVQCKLGRSNAAVDYLALSLKLDPSLIAALRLDQAFNALHGMRAFEKLVKS